MVTPDKSTKQSNKERGGDCSDCMYECQKFVCIYYFVDARQVQRTSGMVNL